MVLSPPSQRRTTSPVNIRRHQCLAAQRVDCRRDKCNRAGKAPLVNSIIVCSYIKPAPVARAPRGLEIAQDRPSASRVGCVERKRSRRLGGFSSLLQYFSVDLKGDEELWVVGSDNVAVL